MGYMESIFTRLEEKYVSPTKDEIMDFVSGKGTKHQKKRSGYSNFATQLREPFAIRESIDTSEDSSELKELIEQAKRIEVDDNGITEKKASIKFKEVLRTEVEKSLEEAITLEEVEEVDIKNLKGLKKEKTQKLKGLESRERAIVRARLIEEVALSSNVSESEAEKIVRTEKLVTEELGHPKYTF